MDDTEKYINKDFNINMKNVIDRADESNNEDDISLRPTINLTEPEPHEPLMLWAEKNIGENPNLRLELIEELRNMIFERGECEPHRTDDAFLLRFLRARNFIVKRAHRLIVNYYEFKEANPNYFNNVDFKKFIELNDSEVISVPPYLDQNGRRMLFLRMGNWNPNQVTIEELFQGVIFLIQTAILEPKYQILGGVCIFDVGNISSSQAWHLTPTILKHMLAVAYTSLPHRTDAFHIINVSKIFDYAFGMAKPFLPDIVKEKIFIHPDLESLHQHVPPENLPKRYDGVHKDYTYSNWIDVIRDNNELLDEIESYGYKGGREFLVNF